LAKECANERDAFAIASKYCLDNGLISLGDVVVVTSGAPFGHKGTTNMIIVENIGEVLVRGHKGVGDKVSGEVVVVLAPEGHTADELAGRLVVVSHCDANFLPVLKKAKGVILQNHIGDTASEKYAALVAKTYEIPLIFRADGAMSVLKTGDRVTIDPQKGLIYLGEEK
jgi:pyruvate kinase